MSHADVEPSRDGMIYLSPKPDVQKTGSGDDALLVHSH
jgi:hypothetical protein